MTTPANSFTDPAVSGSHHEIFGSIKALDTGITNHENWIGEVHQSLICGHHHSNPNDILEDAHCRCKFGQWLCSSETEELKVLDIFHSVEATHQKMHALARDMLIKNTNKQTIAEEVYSEFTAQAIAFKLDVRSLQYKLMSQVCVVDHLTGAMNRYAMHSRLNQEVERLIRVGKPCTICMMDIDHFKKINDQHGHLAGDHVLKMVIDFCRDNLRVYDSIFRYGGEEFLFCLPDAELSEARIVIERLCSNLGRHPIVLPNGERLSVTASFGIAPLKKDISLDENIQTADHALLCAKSQGRNRVCNWGDGLSAFE